MTLPRAALACWCAAAWLFSGAAGPGDAAAQPAAVFVRQRPWSAADGVWLKADTHMHSEHSDGAWTIEALADAAAAHGCDVIAVTDHADRNLQGASEAYFAAVHRARRQHPDMIVLAGLEWNVPPHGGNEHMCILVEPTADEMVILAEFKERFDDLDRAPTSPEFAAEALAWLADKCAATETLAVAIYNHPGRKRDALEPFRDEMVALRAASPLLVGFEGGVGHQAGAPLGAYEGPIQLDERWDPAAATVGGVWDQLLAQGVDAWGAVSTSDFHSDEGTEVRDYPPGKFSETWLCAPERSARGALEALAAGAFFGAQGHIARRVELTVSAAGLPRPAEAGEAIEVAAGAECRVDLRLEIPRWDWQDVANRIDVVEVIGVDATGARVLATFDEVAADQPLSVTVPAPAGGLVIRARGRRDVFQRPDYVFMTNPIRVVTDAERGNAGGP